MSAVTDILAQVPMADLAKRLKVSEKEAKTASTQVITSLLAGMTSNAQSPKGEQALASALTQHASAGRTYSRAGVKLDEINTVDGTRIVKHALGASNTQSAAAIAAKTGSNESLLKKLLPILAPVVIAYVAGQASGSDKKSSGTDALLGGLLGGILGGGSTSNKGSNKNSPSTGGLTDLLGGLLGGAVEDKSKKDKAQQSSGGILGGLLDAIF